MQQRLTSDCVFAHSAVSFKINVQIFRRDNSVKTVVVSLMKREAFESKLFPFRVDPFLEGD